MDGKLCRRDVLRLGIGASLGLVAACASPAPREVIREVPVEVTRVVPVTAAPAPQPTPAPTTPPKPAADPNTPVRGGQIVHGQVYTWPTLDIHLTSWAGSVNYPLVHNYLVRHQLEDPSTGRFKIVGELAESWDQPDPQTLTFKLRKGIKFHDGSDLTADVVKWNLL